MKISYLIAICGVLLLGEARAELELSTSYYFMGADCSGYNGCVSCNDLLDYASCALEWAKDTTTGGCNGAFPPDASDVTTSCDNQFPGLDVSDEAKEYIGYWAQSYAYDWYTLLNCGGDTDTLYDFFVDTAAVLLTEFNSRGWCGCGVNYDLITSETSFILPIARVNGTHSIQISGECYDCPNGGRVADPMSAVDLDKCYIPKGAFSDNSGSGRYTQNCHAEWDPWEERRHMCIHK